MELDHLVIAVRDLQDAAEAWAHALGLHAEPAFRPEGSHLDLARLALDAEGPVLSEVEGAFLELAAPATPDHRLARFIDERGEGMFSISLRVDDLDAAVAGLRARGVPVSDPEDGAHPDRSRRTWPGTRLARIPRASAFGVAIQLIERG